MGLLLSSSGAGPLYAFLGIVIAGGLALYLLTRQTRDSLDAASYPDEPEEPASADPADQRTGPSPARPGHRHHGRA